jgi:hypothetical protein
MNQSDTEEIEKKLFRLIGNCSFKLIEAFVMVNPVFPAYKSLQCSGGELSPGVAENSSSS